MSHTPNPAGEPLDGLDPIIPPPGSPDAVSQGCQCAVIDNAHGKGLLGGATNAAGETLYVISGDCDLHRGWESANV